MALPPPNLVERFDGFAYDYRMRCDCGGAVDVTAETYYREQSNKARAPCGHCGREVHFGPAVALLRDEQDPALDNAAVGGFAWYHTSTWPDWPSANYRAEAEAAARQTAVHFRLDADRMVERTTTRALHLGTYAASIENMLRRMRDQADGQSQFFLYRVATQIDAERVNEGYRDENDEEAAQLGIGDLDVDGLHVVRYLNVHEGTGSLSLAVRPECIAAVQCLPIPVGALALAPTADLSARLDELAAAEAELGRVEAILPRLDHLQLARMRNGEVPDPEGFARRIDEVRDSGYAIRRELDALLSGHCLGGVSPVVADEVRSAVTAWRRRGGDDGVRAYAERFTQMASLLTRSREVVALVACQPWRSSAYE